MPSLSAELVSCIEGAHSLADARSKDPSWLRKCISWMDLTTLEPTDTTQTVERLCDQAEESGVAAVCIYGRFVAKALEQLIDSNVRVAAVAMGFPHGQSALATRILEVESAIADGAQEIDMVIQRGEALAGNWSSVEREIRAARNAAPQCTLKVILETGELIEAETIYRVSRIALDAGANFLKTSTGKIAVGATPHSSAVMLKAIKDSGISAGFKAAGGIRSAQAALVYSALTEQILGPEALSVERFRIGGSALLSTLQKAIEQMEL